MVLRRASFDLTALPPRPEGVDANDRCIIVFNPLFWSNNVVIVPDSGGLNFTNALVAWPWWRGLEAGLRRFESAGILCKGTDLGGDPSHLALVWWEIGFAKRIGRSRARAGT